MHIIKIKRKIQNRDRVQLPAKRRFLQFAQNFFANENHFACVIEAVLFGALLAISVLTIIAAAGAINEILRTAL
jgi:hypothetical protein